MSTDDSKDKQSEEPAENAGGTPVESETPVEETFGGVSSAEEGAVPSPPEASTSTEIVQTDGSAAIEMNPVSPPARNSRPKFVSTLLVEGGVPSWWFLANRQHTRFYVLNVEKVLTDLNPSHTRTEGLFRSAERVIAEETDWPAQFRFAYESSHTQIFPEKRFKAKLFGHAATIVVALELIAAEIDPNYNVYDYLRIVPATFFIDKFNRNFLFQLDKYYVDLGEAKQLELFGDLAVGAADFEQLALNAIEQPNSKRLLQQMATGHTATQWVCDRLREFVAANFPHELHLDGTRQSGDPHKADTEPGTSQLGVKGAAPALRVPRVRNPLDLPPCN